MNIQLAIIDHETASLSEREVFACSNGQIEDIYQLTKQHDDIEGAVFLGTCNRTELYLSLREESELDPYLFLCEMLGIEPGKYQNLVKHINGDAVLRHLCLLTAGAKSQLRGDSQIITQVADALQTSQDCGASDAMLNTVFRLGITAGKKVRTNVDLRIQDDSTVSRAVELVCADQAVQKVLVIGNGMVGRLAASKLQEAGRQVIMTLRQYHKGEALIPTGVRVVSFTDRYEAMAECDAVISATASPHVVIRKDEFEALSQKPRLLIDMAVPRDIEPEIAQMEGVYCYNIDEISGRHRNELKQRQMEELTAYVDEYLEEFHRWEESREKKEAHIERLISPERDRSERRYFPLFIDSMDRQAVVIGGGNIAERRVLTLAEFGFVIRVVSGKLSETLQRLADAGTIEWVKRKVEQFSIREVTEDAWMVLSCTNDRELNRAVGCYCREQGILVNICDARNESTFWFPAVGLSDELTMGLVGTGKDHMNVKKAAAMLRDVIEKKEYK